MSVGEAAPAVSSQGQAGRRWPVRPRVAVAAILAVLVVAAVAVAVWFLLLRHSAAIDKLVPQSADVLVVADLDPSISQKANLQSLSVGTPGDGSQPAVYAYVDHTVLIGNDEAMVREAIDADRGAKGRLVESSGYKATLSLLPSDRLLLAYVDGGRIDQRVKDAIRRGTSGAQVPTASLNQIDAFRSLGFALAAHANGLAADLQ